MSSPERPAATGFRVIVAQDYEDSPALRIAGAQKQTYLYTDRRTAKAEDIPAYKDRPELLQREWYGRGINHRTEDGQAVRELEREAWFVEVVSLGELADLLRITGRSISLESSPETILEVESD